MVLIKFSAKRWGVGVLSEETGDPRPILVDNKSLCVCMCEIVYIHVKTANALCCVWDLATTKFKWCTYMYCVRITSYAYRMNGWQSQHENDDMLDTKTACVRSLPPQQMLYWERPPTAISPIGPTCPGFPAQFCRIGRARIEPPGGQTLCEA